MVTNQSFDIISFSLLMMKGRVIEEAPNKVSSIDDDRRLTCIMAIDHANFFSLFLRDVWHFWL